MWLLLSPNWSVGTATYRNWLSGVSPRSVEKAGPVGLPVASEVPSSVTLPSGPSDTREIPPFPDAMSGNVSERLFVMNAYLPSPVMAIQQVPRPPDRIVPLGRRS